MPPPRLPRPLRLCHIPRSNANVQARYVSDVARGKQPDLSGDSRAWATSDDDQQVKGRSSEAHPKNNPTSSSEQNVQVQTPGADWVGSLFSNVSTIFSGKPLPSPSKSTTERSSEEAAQRFENAVTFSSIGEKTPARIVGGKDEPGIDKVERGNTLPPASAQGTPPAQLEKRNTVNLGGALAGQSARRKISRRGMTELGYMRNQGYVTSAGSAKTRSAPIQQSAPAQGIAKSEDASTTERRSNHQCDHCGKLFPSNRALRSHRRAVMFNLEKQLSKMKSKSTRSKLQELPETNLPQPVQQLLNREESGRSAPARSEQTSEKRNTEIHHQAQSSHSAEPSPDSTPTANTNSDLQRQLQWLLEEVRDLKKTLNSRATARRTFSSEDPELSALLGTLPNAHMDNVPAAAVNQNQDTSKAAVTSDEMKARTVQFDQPMDVKHEQRIMKSHLSKSQMSGGRGKASSSVHAKDVNGRIRFIRHQRISEEEAESLDRRLERHKKAEHGLEGLQFSENLTTEQQAQARVITAFETPGPETQRLIRGLHTQANKGVSDSSAQQKGAESSTDDAANETFMPSTSAEPGEQSLLEELFPEASSYIQPHYTPRNPYPKLELPKDVPLIKASRGAPARTQRQRILDTFQNRSEPITALQLLHCSTELSEVDFRRLVPKGKHIESWVRDGEFHKIIPGRDPLSLERLPFYYLLFKSPESALAYQNNVVRLHKLSGLHQPSSIFSAIPPPKGFLEEGEDLNAALSSYLLKPATLKLSLNMVMQPYNPSLRALIDQGGYTPIVPAITPSGTKLFKVLLHIEGWEPSAQDLYHILVRHAYDCGLIWPFHGGANAIAKLRDVVDVQAKLQPISSANPRAANPDAHMDPDVGMNLLTLDPLQQQGGGKGSVSQIVLNRLYNRWIVAFEDEIAARRFASMWHRRVLPSPKQVTWRDTEERRMVNAEFLW